MPPYSLGCLLLNLMGRTTSKREAQMDDCNLHTVLDCPGGTFLGAGVKTVVLFFERGRSSKDI